MSTVQLERVVWATFCPFRNVTAQAEFSLAEKSKKNSKRYPKLNGRVYTSAKYDAPIDAASIYVGSDAYLVFRHADADKDDAENRGKVVMSYPHILRFVHGLQDALTLAREGCFEEVKTDTTVEFVLTPVGVDAVHHIPDMFSNASFALQPIICAPYERNDMEDGEQAVSNAGVPGMRLYINSWDHYSDITLDEYAAFVDFYERFDLFSTSLAAVQVAVTHMGGIPGLPATRTASPQPTRNASLTPRPGGLNATGKLGPSSIKKGTP